MHWTQFTIVMQKLLYAFCGKRINQNSKYSYSKWLPPIQWPTILFFNSSDRLETTTNIDGNWSRDRIRIFTKQSTHEKLLVLLANHKFTESKWSTEFTRIGFRCRFGTGWGDTRKSQFEKRRFNVTAEYANRKCEYDAPCNGQWKWTEWRFYAISSNGPLHGHHAITAIAHRCSPTVSLSVFWFAQTICNWCVDRIMNWFIQIEHCIGQGISDASKKRSGNTVAKVSRRCCPSDGSHAIGWRCHSFDNSASSVATIFNEICIFAASSAGRFQFGSSQPIRHLPATTAPH